MVTSHKMSENEMGYRGSKSKVNYKLDRKPIPIIQNIKLNFVKEQRVDGSYLGKHKFPKLRCTLMGGESCYQVKIPSKQFNFSKLFSYSRLCHSSSALMLKKNILSPYFITGFVDAEGYFGTTIYKDNKLKTGWRVASSFSIGLNKKDYLLLNEIQNFFGGIGTIRKDIEADALKYSVTNIKDLKNIIIPHFIKYPLLSQKAADFILFSQIVELQYNSAHLNLNGLQEIINIKSSMNLGLSDNIKSEFFLINPVERPLIKTTYIPDPNWISGFVSGDGNFDAGIRESKNIIGFRVYLRFRISQHQKDTELMKLIISYFEAGRLEINSNRSVLNFVISSFSDLREKIIPFFNKYPIHGIKKLDYSDWCEISSIIESGSHLTEEGLNKICLIKSGMNKGRKN